MVGALEEKAQRLLKAFPCPRHGYGMATAAPGDPGAVQAAQRQAPASCSNLQGSVQTHLPEEEEGKQEREASPHPGLEALCKGGRFVWAPQSVLPGRCQLLSSWAGRFSGHPCLAQQGSAWLTRGGLRFLVLLSRGPLEEAALGELPSPQALGVARAGEVAARTDGGCWRDVSRLKKLPEGSQRPGAMRTATSHPEGANQRLVAPGWGQPPSCQQNTALGARALRVAFAISATDKPPPD